MPFIEDMRKSAFNQADKIIKEKGPRLAGSKACTEAGQMLQSSLDSFCDQTRLDQFNIHQGAFLGWIKILVIAYILSVVLLWFNLPLIALILSVLSILILVLQFFFYLPIIDFLYPKKHAYNAVGFIEPQDEVKEQIIISGHHDSARIFNFFIHQPSLYNLRVTGSIALVFILTFYAFSRLFIQQATVTLIINVILTMGLLLILQMWFFASKKGTPGAGDNLLASTIAIEIGKYFSQNKLKHTRVIIASFDAEEEGLRGSRAFAKTYKDLLNQYPTTMLNMDCLYQLKDLFFLTSDINDTVKLDKDLAMTLTEIAKNKGYPATHKPLAFLTGGTDAGELAKQGVKATTLIGMAWSNQTRSSVYHTPQDTLDQVEPELVDATIDIFLTYIES